MREDGQIASVRKALTLLRTISEAEKSISLQMLAEKTGIPKSTCVHLLNTLCECDFVRREERRSGYILGPMSYYLSRNSRYQGRLIRVCHPVMKWLNRQTNQTVILSTLNNNDKYIVNHITGERELVAKGNIILGHLYETATGRALFSSLSMTDRKQFLQRNPLPTSGQWPEVYPSNEKLEKAMAEIRKKGWAVATFFDAEVGQWDTGVGAAFFEGSSVAGAIGLALPYYDSENCPQLERYVPYLLRAAREITHRLSFEDSQSSL